MRNFFLAAVSAAMTAGVASVAVADSSTPGVDHRQARQEQRIDNGIQSGQLTEAEARRLDAGQDRIDNMENRFKADGVVTRGERVRLHGAQNRQSNTIFRKKHNHRRR